MKSNILLLAFLCSRIVLGQGTLAFHATLVPLPAAPAGTPNGFASFGASTVHEPVENGDGSYQVIVGQASPNQTEITIRFARVDSATGVLITETTSFQQYCSGGMDCGWGADWMLPYSEDTLAQLNGAVVTLGLGTSPDAIISGTLQLVPEPTPFALFGLGFLGLIVLKQKCRA